MDNNKTLYDLKISINGAFKKDEINLTSAKKRNIIDHMIKLKCFVTLYLPVIRHHFRDATPTIYTVDGPYLTI